MSMIVKINDVPCETDFLFLSHKELFELYNNSALPDHPVFTGSHLDYQLTYKTPQDKDFHLINLRGHKIGIRQDMEFQILSQT